MKQTTITKYLGKGELSLTCAKCSGVSSPAECRDTDRCDYREVCYANVRQSHSSGKYEYSAGCGRSWSYCRHFNSNQQCCHNDMCNTQLLTQLQLPGPTTTKPGSTDRPSVTTVPPFILTEGINCHVCSGGSCGASRVEPIIHCPGGFPYCMNVVQNDAVGNKYVTKSCASIDECMAKRLELEKSPNHSMCQTFDPAEIYSSSFECSYCCETGYCNSKINPPVETLVLGKRK